MRLRSGYRIIFSLVLLLLFLVPTQAEANRAIVRQENEPEKRLALVIGNTDYPGNARLRNPVNDAKDMAQTLRGLDFEVIEVLNTSKKQLVDTIYSFGRRLRGADVGLFYYAGHGMQLNNYNFLIPVDARIESQSDVEYEAVEAGRVLGKMEDAQARVNIVILDACRNNPFARSFTRSGYRQGLAQMDAPTGTLIAYATKPGAEAQDGEGRNGVFTKYLLREMQVPGQSINEIMMRVRSSVMQETGNKQVPWESSSLTGFFYPAGIPAQEDDSAVVDQRRIAEMEARLEEERQRMAAEMRKLQENRKAPVPVREIPQGLRAWAAPQALYVDADRKVWLRAGYTTSPWKLGNMTVLIEHGPEGFLVDLADTRHSWEQRDQHTPGDIAVAELRFKEFPKTVAALAPGDKAWIMPQAVQVDSARKVWLQRKAPLKRGRSADYCVQVERTSAGYTIDIRHADAKTFTTGADAAADDIAVSELVY